MYKVLVLSIFFFINPLSIFGQGVLHIKNYNTSDLGLSSQNWAFEQDSNGYIFVGNSDGVAIFNGAKWISFHLKKGNLVYALGKNERNIFVGGSNDFGVIKTDSLNNPFFHSYAFESKIDSLIRSPFRQIHSLDEKVIFRNNLGLFIKSKDTIEVIYPTDTFHNSFKVEDNIYISIPGEGISLFNGQTFKNLHKTEKFEKDKLYALIKNGDNLLFGYRNALFQEYSNKKFTPFIHEFKDELTKGGIYRALLKDSLLIVSTLKNGVYFYDLNGNRVDKVDTNNGLLSNTTYSLFQDDSGLIWIASENGITTIELDNPFKIYNKVFQKSGTIRSIIVDRDLYVGGNEGLFVVKENENLLPISGVRRVKQLIQLDSLIVGVSNSGLFVLDGLKIIENKPISLEDIVIKDGRVFVTGEAGTFEILDGRKLELNKIDDSPENQRLFYQKNKLWLVSESEGITSIDSLGIRTKYNFLVNHDHLYNNIGLIDEELFIATDNGLYHYNQEKDLFEFKDLLPDIEVYENQVFIFKQCDEELWVKSNQKLKRFYKNSGRWKKDVRPFESVAYKETISTIACGEGNTWIGSTKNLYRFNYSDWEYKANFKTNITGIYVNNDSLIYGGFGEPVKDIVLPYRDNELRFTYAAASYIDPERNTYSVKLDGFDDNWSDWSLETQKDYTNIPEGNYEFRVRSKNVYKVDGKEDIIYFSVLPPWYRTWWAYLIYLILISSLLYTAFRIRVNQILKVVRMRSKIAGDLHDEVSATLTGISYFAEAIKRDPDQSKKDYFVSLITESADDAKEKITDIVWSINPDNDNWELFLSKCRRYASDLLESKGIDYELKITEHILGKFNMEVRQQLWMIFKEILTNSVRHSEAKRLDVIMDVDGKNLRLIIQDDGKGFDLKAIDHGNGIESIKSRASSINASIDVNTSPGFGTRWRMVLPL